VDITLKTAVTAPVAMDIDTVTTDFLTFAGFVSSQVTKATEGIHKQACGGLQNRLHTPKNEYCGITASNNPHNANAQKASIYRPNPVK
jgi:hypothetical protein